MTVIGNDILDLTNAANKITFNRKRIHKFFASGELKFAQETSFPYPIAGLWTMKESAYKCLLKLGHQKAFSPAKLPVVIIADNNSLVGKIVYENFVFWCKCSIAKDMITCIASNDKMQLEHITSMLLLLYDHHNKIKQIGNKIRTCIDDDEFIISKTKTNIPVLINKPKTHNIEISLSGENKLYFISIFPEWVSIDMNYIKDHLYAS